MIKFFRHIRQSMINQNKTKKYLLYAIGEIILVVIGILIALQINNWNEEKNKRVQEQELLSLINNAVQDDWEELTKNIEATEKDIVSLNRILKHLKQKDSYPDSLYNDFSILTRNRPLSFNQIAIKAFENNESIIRNDSLRYAILNLYNSSYPSVAMASGNFKANLQTFYRPLLKSRFIYPDQIIISNDINAPLFPMEPVNFTALKNDLEFTNAVKGCKSNLIVSLQRYIDVSKSIKHLQSLVDREIK